MHNKRLAEILDEIADMLELEDGDRRFEIRAYRKAALNIETLQEDVADIIDRGGSDALKEIPGVGAGIASKILEYVSTGGIKKHSELKRKYPIDFTTLTAIQGLGPKKLFRLYKAIGVKDLQTLKKAVAQHKVSGIEGFGIRSEEEIGKGISMLELGQGRVNIANALPAAEEIVSQLRSCKYISVAEVAGSARRMKETVGDLDILVVSEDPDKAMDFAVHLPYVQSVLAMGSTKASVVLKMGINCDIRVVEPESLGSAMQYFTGSKDHGVQVRQIAVRKGYSLNEYGLFDKSKRKIGGKTEAEVYNKLGMDYIEPEMRENRGEVEAALAHKLPALVELKDIKGDLHTHTKHSDGNNTIEEMAVHACSIGLEYIGISDHSKSERQAGGMDETGFKAYFDEIDQVNKKLNGSITVLKSGEVDILKDGTLDLENETLRQMDYVVASVHNNRAMEKGEMTNRIIKAMETGFVDILAHPTGRLINSREALQMDLDAVFDAAKENRVIVEIDASPERLDLNDENVIKARSHRVRFSIDTDAHKTSNMDFMRYGVGVARRGWLTKSDVINTLPLNRLLRIFQK